MRTLDELLAESRRFAGLTPAQLRAVARCASFARFAADEEVLREGAAADVFYLLRRGGVALETHVPAQGALRIATLHEGDVLGWSWLFPPYRWHFDARALEPVQAIAFDAGCLRAKTDDDHELGYQLLLRFSELMLERLQATRLQLLDLYGRAGR